MLQEVGRKIDIWLVVGSTEREMEGASWGLWIDEVRTLKHLQMYKINKCYGITAIFNHIPLFKGFLIEMK